MLCCVDSMPVNQAFYKHLAESLWTGKENTCLEYLPFPVKMNHWPLWDGRSPIESICNRLLVYLLQEFCHNIGRSALVSINDRYNIHRHQELDLICQVEVLTVGFTRRLSLLPWLLLTCAYSGTSNVTNNKS